MDVSSVQFRHYVQRVAVPTWKISKEIINYYDLTFIYKGRAIYTVDGKNYKLSAGDVICIPPGSERSAYTFEEAPMHSFALNLWVQGIETMPFPILFHASMDEKLIDLYQEFDKTWLSRSEFREMKSKALFILIFCRLRELQVTPVSSDRRIERAKEYILNNYYKKIDIQKMAAQAGLNHIYFGTLFKKVTGQTMSEYVNKIRINRSKDLLNDGLNITDTALQCGFENVFYFSNVFKKVTGLSPSEYKARPI